MTPEEYRRAWSGPWLTDKQAEPIIKEMMRVAMKRGLNDFIAKEVALELVEATADQRTRLVWPDDFVGDVIDRARSVASRVVVIARAEALEEAAKMLDAKAEALDKLYESVPDFNYQLRATDCRDMAFEIREQAKIAS